MKPLSPLMSFMSFVSEGPHRICSCAGRERCYGPQVVGTSRGLPPTCVDPMQIVLPSVFEGMRRMQIRRTRQRFKVSMKQDTFFQIKA